MSKAAGLYKNITTATRLKVASVSQGIQLHKATKQYNIKLLIKQVLFAQAVDVIR